MWVILFIGALNTVFSLYYYIRVLKAMFMEPRPAGARSAAIPALSAPSLYALLVSLPILYLFVQLEDLSQTANNIATTLLR